VVRTKDPTLAERRSTLRHVRAPVQQRSFQQLKKALIERALGAELTEDLGYKKRDPAGRGSGDSRSGSSAKTIRTSRISDGSRDPPWRKIPASFPADLGRARACGSLPFWHCAAELLGYSCTYAILRGQPPHPGVRGPPRLHQQSERSCAPEFAVYARKSPPLGPIWIYQRRDIQADSRCGHGH
jgi:hypothetical protein